MQLVPTKWQIHGLPSIPETNQLIPSRTFSHIGLNNDPKISSLDLMIYIPIVHASY